LNGYSNRHRLVVRVGFHPGLSPVALLAFIRPARRDSGTALQTF
jgi:hypothetical protein